MKPDLKVLGPRLGKELPKVRAALAEGRYERKDGGYVVEGHALAASEVLVSHEGTPGHAVGRDAGLVVALDTRVTPELAAEGLARELVRRVNEMRKEADLAISDRITLRYGDALTAIMDRHGEFVASETLAASLVPGLSGRGHRWSGDLNGTNVEIEIERA